MFEAVIIEAVTKPSEIVNLFTFKNMDKDMWKHQILKEEEKTKRQEIKSIMELPRYAAFVRHHEMLWQKKRKDFNELEKEYLERKYRELNKK